MKPGRRFATGELRRGRLGPVGAAVLLGLATTVAATCLAANRAGQPAAPPAEGFVIVISEKNPVAAISRSELSLMFMMCEPLWPKGMKVRPVDLPAESPTRESFSRAILGKDVRAVAAHWQRLLFSGDGVPPPVAKSEAQALDMVAANPGGICYVSPGTPLPPGVKTIEVVD
jgi:hypothetical protein